MSEATKPYEWEHLDASPGHSAVSSMTTPNGVLCRYWPTPDRRDAMEADAAKLSSAPTLLADNQRLREANEELIKVLEGIVDRCRTTGGYIGQDGQYQKVVKAAITKALAANGGGT